MDQIFLLKRRNFSKNGYGYNFLTFSSGFLAKKLYHNQLLTKEVSAFSPKHEFL